MKAYIKTPINERPQPGVNNAPTGYYDEGALVDISDATIGEDYDGDNLWYKLSNGNYLWSGGVDLVSDGSGLSEKDRLQFLISFRELKENGIPDLSSKIPPKDLTFNKVNLPADADSLQVRHFEPEQFSDFVLEQIRNLNDNRKHVFIYIHGYQIFSSLKLDLLAHFTQNYMSHPTNRIAKVLFFAWPGQGGPARKASDDRSINAGMEFTKNGLFKYFETLSAELRNSGMKLNLIVHSFGHQLLNGMVNVADQYLANIPSQKIFENIFLMAPDITHLALHKDAQRLRNYFGDANTREFTYHYKKLKDIAENIHVFHDKYDYLLYISTKKFVEKGLLRNPTDANIEEVKRYRNLGNFAASQLDASGRLDGFTFWDVGQLIKRPVNVSLRDFPFVAVRNRLEKHIDSIWEDFRFDKVETARTIFNIKRFPNRHRYLFTCRQVVDQVQALLK